MFIAQGAEINLEEAFQIKHILLDQWHVKIIVVYVRAEEYSKMSSKRYTLLT